MSENLAEKAKSHMKTTYAAGLAVFVGGLSAVAMFMWLVYHVK
jgi:hypothetical protein